jgi:hypothetical protein
MENSMKSKKQLAEEYKAEADRASAGWMGDTDVVSGFIAGYDTALKRIRFLTKELKFAMTVDECQSIVWNTLGKLEKDE